VICTDALAGIAREILVEQQVVTPMWVGLKSLVLSEDWAASIFYTQEDVRKSTGKLICDLPERKLLICNTS
jgi:hypothetical protein